MTTEIQVDIEACESALKSADHANSHYHDAEVDRALQAGLELIEEVKQLRAERAHLRKQRDELQRFANKQLHQIRKLSWPKEVWDALVAEYGDPLANG